MIINDNYRAFSNTEITTVCKYMLGNIFSYAIDVSTDDNINICFFFGLTLIMNSYQI